MYVQICIDNRVKFKNSSFNFCNCNSIRNIEQAEGILIKKYSVDMKAEFLKSL